MRLKTAALLFLVSIIIGCSWGPLRGETDAVHLKGRLYFEDGSGTVKADFFAVLEGDEFFMKVYSGFGESIGYLTYTGGILEIRDGDGLKVEASGYAKIFLIMLSALKNNDFDDNIESNGVILEFIRREGNGFPYKWRIRDGVYEVRVIFDEYDGKRIR